MDFGFGGGGNIDNNAPSNDKNNAPGAGNGNQPIVPPEPNDGNGGEDGGDNGNGNQNEPLHDIAVGTEIEFDGATYRVDESGNVVDAEGNIFKEAKDVKSWVESLEEPETDEDAFSVQQLQEALGFELTDSDGKAIEFENTKEGLVDYVKQVIESSREENYNTALNTLFTQYPFLEDILTYYQANGNSLEGFNQPNNRDEIELDENNEEQQKNIIKLSWKEKGIKGDVDGYIAYLQTTGNLYTTAKEELDSLKEKDAAEKAELKKKAAEAEKEQQESIAKYWGSVKNTIDSGKVAGYEIPANITIERDGKKLAVSRSDFFNYLYRVDKNGKSQYVYDLEKESFEEQLNNDILRAYLKFVGGSYSDLVKIAENKKEVTKLRLQAKNNKTNTIRFKAPERKENTGKINFGI